MFFSITWEIKFQRAQNANNIKTVFYANSFTAYISRIWIKFEVKVLKFTLSFKFLDVETVLTLLILLCS